VPHAPHLAVTSEPWPGSVAVYSSGNDSGYELNRIIAARSTVGVTTNPLFAAPPGIYDRADGLIVTLTSGQLQSVSEAELLDGANLAAIGDGSSGGWELIQFRDAELVGDNTYMLSHRLRGQLGSDAWQPAVWPDGSYFVLLDGTPEQIALTEAQRNMARHYRIGPARRSYDDPSYRHVIDAFEGVGLKPLSPCHLNWAVDATGNIDFDWVRRTRIGGDSWEGLDVPLGEEREAYLVHVMQNGMVVREVEVSSPRWTYSAGDIAADGVTGTFELNVAQVSGYVGAGAFAVLTVNV
jgi:hypothetical protein